MISYFGKSCSQFKHYFLVKHYLDYIYFRDIIIDTDLNYMTEYNTYWNVRNYVNTSFKHQSAEVGLFSADGPYFHNVLCCMFVVIGMMFVFGVFYEVARRHQLPKTHLYQQGVNGLIEMAVS